MKKVLFVCMGNICRSPMAEALFRNAAEKNQLDLLVDSAATSGWEVGNPPHRGTQKKLAAEGISTEGMFARQIKASDFEKFDYIIGMDQANVEDLKELAAAENQSKIFLYLDILSETKGREIPDPWYTGNFEETYQLIQKALPTWLDFLGKN